MPKRYSYDVTQLHKTQHTECIINASQLRWLAVLLASLAALGPFSIDTYLPAFGEIAQQLHASQLEVQQTLSVYLGTFAFMMMWHGSLSDALGRRPVVLVSLAIFSVASVFGALAQDIHHLWLARGLQGLSAGAGMVVGRAIVRDLLDGPPAQRLMAHSAMVFSIAPAIAPIIGGALLGVLGWRSIFIFLALFGGMMWFACWRWLPESLPIAQRQSLQPAWLARSYAHVFTLPPFLRLSLMQTANFLGFFIYVLSAPVFLMQHLGVSAQGFAWLFVPLVAGLMAGSWLSGKLAGKVSQQRCISFGYAAMLTAACANVLMNALMPPTLPWAMLPMTVYNLGMALAMPAINLLVLDLLPTQRGLISSCQAVIQGALNAIAAGIIVPLIWHHPLALACGMAGLCGVGLLLFAGYRHSIPDAVLNTEIDTSPTVASNTEK